VVLITGAAQGIGFEIAKTFAGQGAKIVLTDLNQDQLTISTSLLQELGYEAIGIKCDVTLESDIQNAIQGAISHFGSIDILINNAGLNYLLK
jgi:3-hydroxybutyrate dehydrogenase